MLLEPDQNRLLTSLRTLIDTSKNRLATVINQEMTLLYWNIGKTIQTEILKFEKPGYGEQITQKVGHVLQLEYGKGFGPRVTQRTVQFYKYFPDFEIASTLSTR